MLTLRSRVIYAWENPGVPVDQVVNDVLRAFHHPALRDESIQIQRDMFATVRAWAQETRHPLDQMLSSESVKAGRNHILKTDTKGSGGGGGGGGHAGHNHGTFGAFQDAIAGLGHGKVKGSLWSQIQTRDLSAMGGGDGSAQAGYMSTSPAPRPTSSGGFGYQGGGASQQPPQHGQAASYYTGAASASHSPQPPVPEPGYGGAGYAYGQQQQPPPGQWGHQGPPPPGPPPPGYGGAPGYGQGPPPPFPPYGGQPPHPQGPGWNQNPGGYPGGGHRW